MFEVDSAKNVGLPRFLDKNVSWSAKQNEENIKQSMFDEFFFAYGVRFLRKCFIFLICQKNHNWINRTYLKNCFRNTIIRYSWISLCKKCPYSVLFWSAISRIRTRITPNMDTFHAVFNIVNSFRLRNKFVDIETYSFFLKGMVL